jgi:hypothetical protein
VRTSRQMSKPLEPRLPRWGHVGFSARATTKKLHSDLGFDSADEAFTSICDFAGKAAEREAREATVTIRPAGSPRGEPADREVKVKPYDASFGLTDDQRNRIRAELGSGSKAPRRKLVFRFDS